MSDQNSTPKWAGEVHFDFVVETSQGFKEFNAGLKRISNLISVYQFLTSEGPIAASGDNSAEYASNLSATAEDVLRSMVVLLHALMETYLREIGREWLRVRVKYDPVPVPFFGKKEPNEKISLNDLRPFLGKSVDDLFEESIDNYLATKSFTNIGAVMDFLREIGIDTNQFDSHRLAIIAMMQRRNLIAHSADIIDRGIMPVSYEEVYAWIKATAEFLADVQNSLVRTPYFLKELERRVEGYQGADSVLAMVRSGYQFGAALITDSEGKPVTFPRQRPPDQGVDKTPKSD